MIQRVDMWRAEDGTVFDTEDEATLYEKNEAWLRLIEVETTVDNYVAYNVLEFIEKYTKGWKE